METFYLVDYENVGSGGVAKCGGLTKTDRLVIFYTENQKKIDLDIIDNHGDAVLETQKVPVKSQSVDMHIVSYMGYLIGKYEGTPIKIIIISKDKDYDNLIKYWDEKVDVVRKQKIEVAVKKKTTAAKKAAPKEADKKQAVKKEPAKKTVAKEPAKKTASKDTAKKTEAQKKTAEKESVKNSTQKEEEKKQQSKKTASKETAKKTASKEADKKQTSQKDSAKKSPAKKADPKKETEKKNSSKSESKTLLNTEIQRILAQNDYPKEATNGVAKLVGKRFGKENFKQEVHNDLSQEYGKSYEGIYKLIKPILTKYS